MEPEPNRIGHGNERPKPSHVPLPAYATMPVQNSNGATVKGASSGAAPTLAHSPTKVHLDASNNAFSPRGGSRIAVVLKSSPVRRGSQSFETVHQDAEGLVISDLTPQGRRRALLSSQPPATSEVEPSATRQVDHISTTPSTAPARPRGRPKGWRPGMSYGGHPIKTHATAAASREARQVKPKPPPNGFPKRRGRRPKAPSPQPRDIYRKLNPPFFAFICEWQECKAELHNLDTLRRHVYVVHGWEPTCRWGKCAQNPPRQEFEDDESFEAHAEQAHLVPFAWHVGDGPNNSSGKEVANVEAEIPDYLKDENGNQVTPSVKDQKIEDFVTWRNNRRRLRELITRRDENLPDDGLDEVVESEE
ncbi:hypothetical protein AK830_g8094 [Neonectria ditissima]|uniref:C2H2-type domain-containing protein n=1 Tax=Neonectria ditissima TaxID=78410 RepID=A0A0P7B8S3_9HYPO|nr:hypothetical protein AK830_g8094 [Neonectria ditissima]